MSNTFMSTVNEQVDGKCVTPLLLMREYGHQSTRMVNPTPAYSRGYKVGEADGWKKWEYNIIPQNNKPPANLSPQERYEWEIGYTSGYDYVVIDLDN